MKIVVDCANGAAYHIAPMILRELGAEVVAIGISPNGFNINENCGSTSPAQLCETVVREKADIGIALDGDADRILVCDERGKIADGDQLLAIIATHCQKVGTLKGGGIVATHMSNMGLERYLADIGLTLARTNVGDRNVVEHMRAHGFNLGGEQSGHIVLSDYVTTGDGIIAGLQVLAYLREVGGKFSAHSTIFTPMPQLLRNVRYSGVSPLKNANVQAEISKASEKLAGNGRLFVRESGTEPLIRIMAEGVDAKEITRVTEELAQLMSA